MRKLLFILVLVALALPSFGQTTVTGEVFDSLSLKPVPNAAVTLMRDGKTVSFARSGADGRFEVRAKTGDRVQVTCLGYMKKNVTITEGQKIEVSLTQKAFMLKEVQVKGTPVFGRQDTIVFDLKRYAGQRDNSLKDVLKKLPGVDVDKNGKITFNGKDITRFTVEDLDLTGGRYNQLTEALKARDVDKAEVVEHDQPVKALQGKVFTDDVAMNIKLRPEARDKWMFTLRPEVVVGFPLKKTRPQGGADALQIGKRRQWMYSADYDQSGKDLSRNDRVLATGGMSAYGAGTSVPGWFSAPTLTSPIDEERVRFNRSVNVTAKNTRKTKGGSEQRVTAGYLHTDEEQQTGNTSVYYFDGRDPVQTDETDRSRMRTDRIYVDFNHNTNTQRAYGNEYFSLTGTLTDGYSTFTGAEGNDVRQRVKLPEIQAQNTFTRLFTRDRHSWTVYSTLDFHYAPQEMTVDGQTQKLNNILYYADNYALLTLNRKFLTHRYTLGVTAEHLNLQGGHTALTVYGRPTWEYKRMKTVLRLAVPVNWKILTERGEHYLDASPLLYANIKSGRRGEWTLSSGYNMSTGRFSDYAVGSYMSDYRTQVVRSGIVPRQGTFHAGISYDYKRPVTELFMSFGANYNYNHGNVMTDMTITDGQYLLETVANDWHGQAVSAKALVSKGFFDIHLKTKLELNYAYATGQQLSEGSVTDYASNVYSASPEIVFSPSFGTFTYRATFSLNKMKTDEMGQNSLLDWTQRLAYTQTVGKVDISIAAVHYRNELQSAGVINTLLADAGVVWRLKKVRLSADVRNLFNKRRYTVTNYSGVMSSTNYYELRPREVILTAQVSI